MRLVDFESMTRIVSLSEIELAQAMFFLGIEASTHEPSNDFDILARKRSEILSKAYDDEALRSLLRILFESGVSVGYRRRWEEVLLNINMPDS